jgi:hypothetical protein
MKNNYADNDAQPRFATDAEASGTAAVVTIPANTEEFWAIDWISWSYGGDPTGGNLQVSIGGTVVWQVDITIGGPGHIEFDKALYGLKNQAVVVTLANGGVANKVNVRYR